LTLPFNQTLISAGYRLYYRHKLEDYPRMPAKHPAALVLHSLGDAGNRGFCGTLRPVRHSFSSDGGSQEGFLAKKGEWNV